MYKFKEFKGNNIYILLDSILAADYMQDWFRNHNNLKRYNLFESTVNSHIDFFASPLLLDVTYLNSDKINEFIVNFSKLSSSLNIFSTNLDINELLIKLKPMMFPEIDGKRKFFRFYDPLYFSKLDEIFDDKKIYNVFSELYCLMSKKNSYKYELEIIKVV